MSETSDTPAVPTAPAAAPHQTPKVFKAAAWVVVAAGTVFIVAVIFFSGYTIGKHDGYRGFHHLRYPKEHAMLNLRPATPHGGPASGHHGGPGHVPRSAVPTAP